MTVIADFEQRWRQRGETANCSFNKILILHLNLKSIYHQSFFQKRVLSYLDSWYPKSIISVYILGQVGLFFTGNIEKLLLL